MSEPTSEIPSNPSRLSSFFNKAKERITPSRPHPDIATPPEEYFKTPDHKYPAHGPGPAAYEFTNADWTQWLEVTMANERASHAQEFVERGLQQGSLPTKEEFKKMGILAKGFVDGIQAVFDAYRKSGKLPAGQSLPTIFIGSTQGGNLAEVTTDGERTILSASSLRTFAGRNIQSPKYELDHSNISPLQRVVLAGVHEGDHIVYYGLHPEDKKPTYVNTEANISGFAQKVQDDSPAAYDSSDIELSAVRQELQYAITNRYSNDIVQKLQRRIQAAEAYRKKSIN